MLYQVRSGGGKSEEYLYGSLMNKNGSMQLLSKEEVTLQPLRKKTFNNADYAMDWRIVIPSLQVDIETRPLNDNQFLSTRIPYWEGAVSFTGSHHAVGYMELFGDR